VITSKSKREQKLRFGILLPYLIGDSSRLRHYLNFRFPLGLLAILLAISDRLFIGLSG
jgi:hypothetical protein